MATVQMIPPGDGSRNIVTVSNRTYSALPQMAIPVQLFDVPELQANGWQQLLVSAVSGAPGETLIAKLRRLRQASRNDNPIESLRLTGSKPWVVLTGTWAGNTPVTVGKLYSNGGLTYLCVTTGTTAGTGGPTGTSSVPQTDGTAQWIYWCGAVGDILSNGGNVYQIAVAGVPATSGTGPSGIGVNANSGLIVDGSIGATSALRLLPS
jgi:hypothetical protein